MQYLLSSQEAIGQKGQATTRRFPCRAGKTASRDGMKRATIIFSAFRKVLRQPLESFKKENPTRGGIGRQPAVESVLGEKGVGDFEAIQAPE